MSRWSRLLLLVVATGVGAAEPEAEKNVGAEAAANTNAAATGKPATGKPATSGQLGMSVTGTLEAPKVLYIVPWKSLDAVPAEPYVSGLLDEVFAPVDPVVFARSVQQHEQRQQAAVQPAAEQR